MKKALPTQVPPRKHRHLFSQVAISFFPSGFAAAYLKEQFACEELLSFLRKRREHHLSILTENSSLTQLLLVDVSE